MRLMLVLMFVTASALASPPPTASADGETATPKLTVTYYYLPG